MMRRAAALRCGEQRQPALELAPRGRREGKARVGNRRAGTTRAATDRGSPEDGGLRMARAAGRQSSPGLLREGARPGTSGTPLQSGLTRIREAGSCLLALLARDISHRPRTYLPACGLPFTFNRCKIFVEANI